MAYFKPGDVVWAKMRGHPPWPAVISQNSTQLAGVPTGRYSVRFYGTYETAIMKSADLFDFVKHRHQFEVRRENKGFLLAVQEAREAVGLSSKLEKEELPLARSHPTPSTSQVELANTRLNSRSRRPSSRFNSDDYVLQPLRGRTSNQPHHVPDSPQKTKTKASKNERKILGGAERRRKDSGSSVSSFRKRNISASFDFNGFDNDPMLTPVLGDGLNNSLLDCFHSDGNTEMPGVDITKSKRIGKPKLFEDFLTQGRSRTPSRERNNSTSSSGRTRLISGVSDILEELADQQFNAADFMSVLNDFDDDRPVSPEEPLPMPAPNKYCSDCACLCELYDLKWRRVYFTLILNFTICVFLTNCFYISFGGCTNKSCLKWNGNHDPYGKGGELSYLKENDVLHFGQCDQFPDNLTALPDPFNNFPESKEIKLETSELESIVPLVDAEPFKNSCTDNNEQLSFAFQSIIGEVGVSSLSTLSNVKETPSNNSLTSTNQVANHSFSKTLPRRQLGAGRPKSYKVEKTPPVTENGQRLCAFCGGQVRPQMCGGNKHRWRCVDKKCRKWYGWVRSNEEIPKDLGKKGRWKDLALKIRRKGVSEEDGDNECNGEREANAGSNVYISDALCEKQQKKVGRPPKSRIGKVKLRLKKKVNGVMSESEPSGVGEGERPKRKYTKREKPAEDGRSLRFSPIPQEALAYRPSAMEKRGRWWANEKRRHDVSPEREWNARSPLDTAAAMHVLAHSMRIAANTLADEQGTVNGSLDLLMDALMSSLAPLLSLTAQLPTINVSDEILQQLWNASSVHTPIFS